MHELLHAAETVIALFAKGHADPLAAFRDAFERRYGDREVPLVEALDEELGIGFEPSSGPASDPSPLLVGLPFTPPEEEGRVPFGYRAQFVQWKLAEAIAAGAEELRLDPRELERFADPDAPGLGGAFHLLASLLAPDAADTDAPRALFDSAAGPSGARLLGRFGFGDPALAEHVRAHVRREEALRPDVVYFELVHLPEGRVGNILARPVLREFELAYLGASGAPPDRTISVLDLTVRLEGGRIALRSRALGREVRPRLSSAHYAGARSLGLYRFLTALQAEGVVEGAAWHWGPFEHQPRLPRVRIGQVVLARRQWNARRDEARRLREHSGHAAFLEAGRWRAARDVPRFAGLVHADNVLPVDFDQPLSVAAFLDALKGRDGFSLVELFPGARPDAARSPEGGFTNEVVIPVVRAPASAAAAREPARGGHVDRGALGPGFAPGSEWLSAKLYGGPKGVDRALVEALRPALATLVDAGDVRRVEARVSAGSRRSWTPATCGARSSCATPIRAGTCACGCTASPRRCSHARCRRCAPPPRRSSTPGCCTRSSSRPTGARSCATAGRPRSKRARRCSTTTRSPRSTCSPVRPGSAASRRAGASRSSAPTGCTPTSDSTTARATNSRAGSRARSPPSSTPTPPPVAR